MLKIITKITYYYNLYMRIFKLSLRATEGGMAISTWKFFRYYNIVDNISFKFCNSQI